MVRVRCCIVLAAAILLGAFPAPLAAHHSVTAEFDLDKRVTLVGVITHVDWMNPHTYFYIDVTNPKTHKVETWAFQLNSPRVLSALGWSHTTLMVGDIVTASGSPALSGAKAVYTREIRFQDGRKLSAESTQ